MKEITITFEKTESVSETFKVPNSVYNEIVKTKRIPDDYFDLMLEKFKEESEDIGYDYYVIDDEDREIVNWGG